VELGGDDPVKFKNAGIGGPDGVWTWHEPTGADRSANAKHRAQYVDPYIEPPFRPRLKWGFHRCWNDAENLDNIIVDGAFTDPIEPGSWHDIKQREPVESKYLITPKCARGILRRAGIPGNRTQKALDKRPGLRRVLEKLANTSDADFKQRCAEHDRLVNTPIRR
jgi:hypothetical protein